MSDFQRHQLQDLGKIVTGRTPPNNDNAYYGGAVDFLTPSDFTGGRKVLATQRKLSAYGVDKLARCVVNHAVGVSCIGWQMGQSVLIERPTVTNQQINSLIVDPKMADLWFVYYNLSSRRDEIFALGAGGSRTPILNKSDFGKLPILLPSLAEQQKISAFLSVFDDKIELNRRMNETLEAIVHAIFRDWFVDFGPTYRKVEGATDPVEIMGGLVHDAERAQVLADLFPARLGNDGLPERWTTKPIGDLAEIVGGSTPSTAIPEFWENGVHAWVTPKDLSNLDGLVLFSSERRVTDQGLRKITSGLSPKGTVLLSSRAPIGYLAIAATNIAVNQGFIAIRPSQHLPTAFALFWCRENMDLIKSHANGSTFQEISKRNFRPLPAIQPGLRTIEAFTAFAEPILERIELNLRNLSTLADTRDSLLPKLMSGEVKLADVVPDSRAFVSAEGAE
ncbi:restriction endonuclease subunit S [Rhizobium leguminosarum]|uniref:restriction endonuclease subunit S n=1 Tax=Rhizobium leguminosarum TaxID=384 RepID=UPI003F94BF73